MSRYASSMWRLVFWLVSCATVVDVPPPTPEEAWTEVCAELESARSAQAQGDQVGSEQAWNAAHRAYASGIEPVLTAHDRRNSLLLSYELGRLHSKLTARRGDPGEAVEAWVVQVEQALDAIPHPEPAVPPPGTGD